MHIRAALVAVAAQWWPLFTNAGALRDWISSKMTE